MNTSTRKMLGLVAAVGLLVACAITASEPAKPAETVSDKEKAALGNLHRNAVEIFIDRPGFGIRRLVLNLDDLLTGPKSLAERNAKSEIKSELTDLTKPGPMADPKAAKKPSHYAVEDVLLQWGYGRFATDDGKETWKLDKFHLVGLVKKDDPVVYLADKNPKKFGEEAKADKDIPTRAVNDFEKAALAAIRNGEASVAEKNGKAMRLLAPIFAGKRCAACHDEGTLLGAFTYELERVAHDPKLDGERPGRRR